MPDWIWFPPVTCESDRIVRVGYDATPITKFYCVEILTREWHGGNPEWTTERLVLRAGEFQQFNI